MEKIRLQTDPYNRLVSRKTGKASGLSRFRNVLDGRFKTGGNNDIIYEVKSPQAGDTGIPHQVKLKGRWSLDDNHDLELTLDKWGRQTSGDRLILKGEMINASADSLAFAITTTSKDRTSSTYVLELGGAWQADENNRMVFKINKQNSQPDALTFTGAWEVNKKYQLIYTYEKAGIRKKETHALAFKGEWKINENARISYILDKDSASGFDFGLNAAVFKEDSIRLEIGIGTSKKQRSVIRQISFYGAWRLKEDTIEFKLNTKGASIELSRSLVGSDGRAFLKLLKEDREIAVLVGMGLKW